MEPSSALCNLFFILIALFFTPLVDYISCCCIIRMKSALEALNFGFTVDEVGSLIHEVDENGDGTVGLHDFWRMSNEGLGCVRRHRIDVAVP